MLADARRNEASPRAASSVGRGVPCEIVWSELAGAAEAAAHRWIKAIAFGGAWDAAEACDAPPIIDAWCATIGGRLACCSNRVGHAIARRPIQQAKRCLPSIARARQRLLGERSLGAGLVVAFRSWETEKSKICRSKQVARTKRAAIDRAMRVGQARVAQTGAPRGHVRARPGRVIANTGSAGSALEPGALNAGSCVAHVERRAYGFPGDAVDVRAVAARRARDALIVFTSGRAGIQAVRVAGALNARVDRCRSRSLSGIRCLANWSSRAVRAVGRVDTLHATDAGKTRGPSLNEGTVLVPRASDTGTVRRTVRCRRIIAALRVGKAFDAPGVIGATRATDARLVDAVSIGEASHAGLGLLATDGSGWIALRGRRATRRARAGVRIARRPSVGALGVVRAFDTPVRFALCRSQLADRRRARAVRAGQAPNARLSRRVAERRVGGHTVRRREAFNAAP
jgi:hypothetical protein